MGHGVHAAGARPPGVLLRDAPRRRRRRDGDLCRRLGRQEAWAQRLDGFDRVAAASQVRRDPTGVGAASAAGRAEAPRGFSRLRRRTRPPEPANAGRRQARHEALPGAKGGDMTRGLERRQRWGSKGSTGRTLPGVPPQESTLRVRGRCWRRDTRATIGQAERWIRTLRLGGALHVPWFRQSGTTRAW
jgi:hypothetical protein